MALHSRPERTGPQSKGANETQEVPAVGAVPHKRDDGGIDSLAERAER
jgi:hypothetical protein